MSVIFFYFGQETEVYDNNNNNNSKSYTYFKVPQWEYSKTCPQCNELESEKSLISFVDVGS